MKHTYCFEDQKSHRRNVAPAETSHGCMVGKPLLGQPSLLDLEPTRKLCALGPTISPHSAAELLQVRSTSIRASPPVNPMPGICERQRPKRSPRSGFSVGERLPEYAPNPIAGRLCRERIGLGATTRFVRRPGASVRAQSRACVPAIGRATSARWARVMTSLMLRPPLCSPWRRDGPARDFRLR